MNHTVADFVIKQLVEWGIDTGFGLPGDSFFPLIEAVDREQRFRFFNVRNETAAGYMASGYAKVKGRPAVCITDGGPGTVNLLNGLFDASNDGVPVIAVTGQVPRDKMFTQYIQSSNQNAVFKEAVAYTATVTVPEQAGQLLETAVKDALDMQKAVHLAIPEDVQSMQYPGTVSSGLIMLRSAPKLDMRQVEAAVSLLNTARRPVILAGYGARGLGDLVAGLAEKIGAAIVVSSVAKGAVHERHPQVVGVLGEGGSEPARRIIDDADVVLIAGSTWWPEGYVPKNARVIQIDINPRHLGAGKDVAVGVLGDTREVLPLLTEGISGPRDAYWMQHVKEAKRERDAYIDHAAGEDSFPLHPGRLIHALEKQVPENAVVVLDTGDHTLWFLSSFRASFQDVILSGMWRAMGYGLPAALGAKVAAPDRPVLALCGDGGLAQLPSELATAAQYNLPVAVVVSSNQAWALEGYKQVVRGYSSTAVGFSGIDFAALAASMGVQSQTINSPEDLDQALEKAFTSNAPYLLQVPTALSPAPELAREMGGVRAFNPQGMHPTSTPV